MHLNDNFAIYLINELGQGVTAPYVASTSTDSTGGAQNYVDDGGQFSGVIESLGCENMVPLKCYEGSGLSFGVKDPCEENMMGKDDQNKRIVGGCYYFVDNPLIASIPKDIKAFEEWKSRFRFNFGACRGVISHVFQNNWVNGTLYSFSFRKQTIFDSAGNVKKYKFCGTKDPVLIQVTTNQGPIYFDEDRFSFFYRSTPFDYSTGQFIGQLPMKKNLLNNNWEPVGPVYKGMNNRNLFFPTTIMDLGPRDKFAKEICLNPQLEGYLVDTLKTSSFEETGDLLQLFILSRLINSKFWEQALNLGDASINKIFSRTQDRIDGDAAQMFSINSVR